MLSPASGQEFETAQSAGRQPTGSARALHLSPDERAARGKAARAEVPRSSHASYEPGPNRPDPVDLLESQAATRVPQLVPIRYGRMLVSPFAFFRGAALIMASDLAGTPRSGLKAQLCGDAHLSNFGVFASPERRLIFDINDFDETLPGPWEWDVKRLAASFAVAGRENGYTAAQHEAILLGTVRAYRERMRELAEMRDLDVWYAHLNVDEALTALSEKVDPKALKSTRRSLARARTRDSMQAFRKLTHLVDGKRRIVSDPPLVVPIEELVTPAEARKLMRTMSREVDTYRASLQSDRRKLLERFQYVHLAHKVVGVGSVGMRAWILLLVGRDDDDPLFLQLKEAQASVLEKFLGPSECANAGERVVAGQRLMQAAGDILLGWLRFTGLDGKERDYYVRQLRDWKGSATVEAMLPTGMAHYGELCGRELARAHARSGDRIAIAAYLGRSDSFDRAVAAFANAYADQTERDYEALVDAVESGRIVAETGL